jgi:glycosyltransferase involved in cell wall biosynthesis
VWYFSYLAESLSEYTDDADLLSRIRVLGSAHPMSRGRRAVTMPWTHDEQFRACGVLRVFQVTGVIPALIARRRFGVPFVTTYGFSYDELSHTGAKRTLKRLLTCVGLRRAAAVIVTTDTLRAQASRLARRVELIPNGVDTALFAPMPRPPTTGGPRRILYVGRLSPEKNLETVVAATSYLGDAAMDVMVGSGLLRDRLAELARDKKVAVEFPGVVDQRRLPDVYASADVFVLASFTEGHPKVLLEAMSCGLPCVASDCAGNRSLITHGETGLLFDPRRPEDLADCLKRVLTDDALAARLGSAGRELVESRFNLGALVAREIDLVRSVAAVRR